MNDILLGASHITDLNGVDHILFLIALAASFDLSKIGRMALLATAFTLGHSLTLFLAGLDLVRASLSWIEFLIPITIVIMAVLQINGLSFEGAKRGSANRGVFKKSIFALTAFFGLIHGLGFSSFYRIAANRGEGIVMPLLKFNLGVELGQLLILLVTLSVFSLARALGATERSQQLVIGGVVLGLAGMMALENVPF
ncbi:MAG TPA: HupE/UreJ family protein [Flavobacteriales bacterium]|nr:HupE/UreJ family protein [Flavobacteriales bacterium]HIB77521.1 HupE/UreJ family protein [Flavobacteriales bacterium]HIN41141.1 HupE/UreJ family protein [Flavobacteriales bacterium]HIO15772.1 HupE/UreJ family protein [Flavobacteriales bacterium]